MNTKPKCFAIFAQLPFPQFSGDRQQVFNEINILSKYYQLEVVIICRTKPTKEDYLFLQNRCSRFHIFYLSKLKLITNVLTYIFKLHSLQVACFFNKKIQQVVNNGLQNCDFAFATLIRVAKYLEKTNKPKLIDFTDTISLNYERSYENVRSFLLKQLYKYESKRLAKFEEYIISKYDAIFLVNYNEQQFWLNKLLNNNIIWLPPGIKNHLFNYNLKDDKYLKSIVFIGKMDYQPNIDAIVWFLEEVWHNIKTQDLSFYIIGVNPPKRLLQKCNQLKNVHFTGFLEDPYIILNSASAVVSPMQTGGGIQNKILEGMALKKVNIVTTRGSEGIRFAENGKHLIIEDDPIKMADIIDDVVVNPNKYKHIGEYAYNLVSQQYTWQNFEIILTKTINQLVSKVN